MLILRYYIPFGSRNDLNKPVRLCYVGDTRNHETDTIETDITGDLLASQFER